MPIQRARALAALVAVFQDTGIHALGACPKKDEQQEQIFPRVSLEQPQTGSE